MAHMIAERMNGRMTVLATEGVSSSSIESGNLTLKANIASRAKSRMVNGMA